MKEIRIGNRVISHRDCPYFIADIAANHDGDINRAFLLIELAKKSGADAAKFQNFKADKIVSDMGFKKMDGQLSHQKSWGKSVFEVYQDASVDDQWTPLLKAKCNEVGIEYLTTAYDFESADWADKYVNGFKIGSGDITWHEMLAHIASKKKPIMLATGAATLKEVEMAMDIISKQISDIVLMQCNTNYTIDPDNFKYINLNVLKTYKEMYPDAVLGLSDHTMGFATVLGAIALGARVIEKHFTDDNNRAGPDHRFSTTPRDWEKMVIASKQLFSALGDGVKRIELNETGTSIVQKRGLYLLHNIPCGDMINHSDLIPLRPRSEKGFEPYEIDRIVGKKALKNLMAYEMLLRGDIE